MGYGGGTVTQPILGGFDELGKLLLQGQAQVTATVLEIERRRTDEVNQLAKLAGEISATGIEGYDNVIQNFAAKNADVLAVAHEMNRRGQLSLGEVSKIRSKLMKNNQLLASQSKIHDENMKAIYEGVENKTLSPLSIDAQNALWFSDPNMKNSVFKAPALDSEGKAKFDAKGNPITIMRKAEEALQLNLIDNDMYITKMKEVQSVDADGNPMFKDGYPVTETKVWQMPAAKFLSPSRKQFLAYNLVDEITDLNKTLGKRIAVVDKSTGVKTVMPYEKVFETPGTMIYGYTLAEEELSDIVGRVEKTLDGLTDEQYTSILHDFMGARAEWQPEFKGPRSLDIVNSEEELNHIIGTAGQTIKIPKYYDAMGNAIGDFTYDPLVLQTGKDGTIHLTDEQRSIGKAFVRDAMLKSLNVTQKEFKEHKEGKRGTKKPPEYLDVTLATHSKKTTEGVFTNQAAGYDYLNGIAIQQTLANQGGNSGVANLQKARTQFDSTGKVSETKYVMDDQLNAFIKLVEKAEDTGMVKGINISSDVKKIAEKDFNLTTTTGQKLENFSQAFLVNNPGELPKLAFVGDAIMASSIDDYKLKYGGGDVAEEVLRMNIRNQVVSPAIVVADNRKAAQFYRIMYKNNPQFQKIVEGAGFKGISANHSVHGDNAVMDALITYFTNKQ